MTMTGPPTTTPKNRGRLTAVAAAGGIVALALVGIVLAVRIADGDERTQPPVTSAASTTTDDPTTTGTATTATTPTPTPTQHTIPDLVEVDASDPNADVLDAYERATRALLEANALSDPNYPPLLETTQGEALDLARSSIEVLRNQGQRALFEGRIARLEVVDRSDATAVVHACGVDQGQLVDIESGQRLDDGSVTLNALAEVMVFSNGTWKIDHGLPADVAICEGITP
jgi:hypothetical protein